MQPVQLSLLPQEEHPAPPSAVLGRLPDPDLTEAVRVLGRLIAAAFDPQACRSGDRVIEAGPGAGTVDPDE